MDAAAYQSYRYSPVVCPASFSDLLAASRVAACTAYNERDYIKCNIPNHVQQLHIVACKLEKYDTLHEQNLHFLLECLDT